MDIQRLRNLTTGRLHTKMEDIYEDMEFITEQKGIMTHMLPSILNAMTPWLEDLELSSRFWDGLYDTTHNGDVIIIPMNKEELEAFWERYRSPFSKEA